LRPAAKSSQGETAASPVPASGAREACRPRVPPHGGLPSHRAPPSRLTRRANAVPSTPGRLMRVLRTSPPPPPLSVRRCAPRRRQKVQREGELEKGKKKPRTCRGFCMSGAGCLGAHAVPAVRAGADWRPLLGGRPLANLRVIRRMPSGVASFFRALPCDTTIVSTTVLSGRCFTSFRLMNRPVTASRATFFLAVCGVFAMVLAPLSKLAFTGDTWILGALSVREAHRFTGGLPRTDWQHRISRMRSVVPQDGEHHYTNDRN
jgi:hypothetical protein